MVLFAQVFTAAQFVVEERVMERYNVAPLLAVGLEGVFGFVSVLAAMPLLHLAFGRSHPGGFFDVPTGYHQIVDNPAVWIPGILIALSIAFFNWFGLSVTRSVSATARSTLDTCRTIIIWVISMSLGWESFRWMQVLGFAVLIYGGWSKLFLLLVRFDRAEQAAGFCGSFRGENAPGVCLTTFAGRRAGTFIFNGIVDPPFCRPPVLSEGEFSPLLNPAFVAVEDDDGQLAARI
ncbi:MAG: hypothetical protein BJ554DRAFT_7095 [Olpidium bornovanus]|uniref:Uncharacterized protein n=1 Tax=Olpidium bornovanus TaxID=278681 RepID=A0A8H7ZX02_9FUNG|nr:MAG: hypothetical protein BJ554DRAFT_7095 [Olpidium bornovanus]